jgi:aminopeptidase-like protein
MIERGIRDVLEKWDGATEGGALYQIVSDLFPTCRSITGEGVRQSLRYLQQFAPMGIREVPTGAQVFDWVVPKEWNIRDAWIKNEKGEKIVDFQKCNLHVLNYSIPVRRKVGLAELQEHLFSLPDAPDWIPYRTSYYKENWGFCLTHRQREALTAQEYEICIDSSLEPGHLSYGELRIQGKTDDEILISCHSCHPSLANDNLSGMAIAAKLAQLLANVDLRYSYRFLWIPGTIGAITWLAQNEPVLPNIKHGLVLSCLGDAGAFTYKRTRSGIAEIDRVVEYVLKESGRAHEIVEFSPYGYDERQYGSPGINLPVGCFMRTQNGKYSEYHTSADNLDLVKRDALADSLYSLLSVLVVLEEDQTFVNLNPKCEPQLGRRGLYRQMGGTSSQGMEQGLLWVLNFSDGNHSLLDIAVRSRIPFESISQAAKVLMLNELLGMAGTGAA